MDFILRQTRLGLLNSAMRLPFRYGIACLTRCPQTILEATIEVDGRLQNGYAGESLPPSWFDKTPNRPYRQQVADMLASIGRAQGAFLLSAAVNSDFFSAWRQAYDRCHGESAEDPRPNPLLTSFGISLMERAVMDALARHAGLSFAQAVRTNLYQICPGEVHEALRGLQPADWLPPESAQSIFVRHTVGFGDPLTDSDVPAGQRIDDGLPQSLEEHIEQSGVRYFKLKISPDVNHTRYRMLRVAEICQKHLGADYQVTLDANELFQNVQQLEELVTALRATPQLNTLLKNILAIEQPLARPVAFAPQHADAIRRVSAWRPVIIDESDATLDAYARAMDYGYRGTSSKSCKGPVKSLLNAGLTWLANRRGTASDYLVTGEDLSCLGVVPLQADLALVATLGLTHVERNAHHYYPGLNYLPDVEQRAALAAHGDLYHEQQGRVAPRISQGRMQIASLNCPGSGFAALPDMALRQPADEWRFDSLGLKE
jgi:L-alanine-DL-glutamate epimerase-like enolase superfamily enzyme